MYDVHTHFVPPSVLDWLRDNPTRVPATWEQRIPGKAPFLTVNQKWSFEFKAAFRDERVYLADQAAAGVIHSLVSPIPQLFLYDFPNEVTEEAARVYNDAMAAWVSQHSDRLSGLATVPLNGGERAADVLESALSAGLLGAIVGPGAGGVLLSAPDLRAFWEVADANQAIVFVHPLLNEDPRIQKNRMPNLIGVPWETTLCALDLMLSGTLDRYPNARVLLAHGGGFLPYQIGRYERGYEVWPGLKQSLSAPPTEYLRRMYYDSVLWHPLALDFLTELVGAERVMPGSDYPFDLSVWPPTAVGDLRHVKAFLQKSEAPC
ncbi:amidohydrolase family protein [Alicyclobacillus sp. ALC3]|uniref:amidohydrolase family protein n=1 Tax=Alicyclobacillus sp. ALC3 TaxID=2796143 RepID=UPI0023795D7E|nr:amidohydrolase family protein [Alicyclobacillus sp. ALC3]WDL95736.1 amidohydrolase [Alicyclobacillus sp. ALC3]